MPLFLTPAPEFERGVLRKDPDKEPNQEEVFSFLNFLRSTGKTNMLGATPYVAFYLDIDETVARDHLLQWIELPQKQQALTNLINGE